MRANEALIMLTGALVFAATAAVGEQHAQTEEQPRTTESTETTTGTQTEQAATGQAQSATRAGTSDTAGAETGEREGTSRQAQAGTRGATAIPMVMMVVPVKVASTNATDTAMRNGCWARLYDKTDHKGDSFTLVGPIEMSNMLGPFGANWENVSSIETGRNASVTLYDNIQFRDRVAKVKPGQKVKDLGDEKLGFFEQVRSMRIDCAQSGRG